jgi:hypothetical protein
MNEKNLKLLYYIAWIIGFFAVGILLFGIIRELM